uniref:Uncharacterized protein n=1 Tax=viral metagenome TaxID=1070528 RepID=A0A6C0J2V4_9ZZZZ
MLYSLFNKVYNMFSKKPVINTIKPDLEYSSYGISDKNDKELRINILLDIKNIKNTYYKYTYNKKYSDKLYKDILKETEDENGVLVSNNSKIYDSDIIKYIECRKELFENKNYVLKKNLEELSKLDSLDSKNLLYIIDLNEKEIFNYCYDIIKCYDDNIVKDLLFSVIIYNSNIINKYQIIKDYEKLKIVL